MAIQINYVVRKATRIKKISLNQNKVTKICKYQYLQLYITLKNILRTIVSY